MKLSPIPELTYKYIMKLNTKWLMDFHCNIKEDMFYCDVVNVFHTKKELEGDK